MHILFNIGLNFCCQSKGIQSPHGVGGMAVGVGGE